MFSQQTRSHTMRTSISAAVVDSVVVASEQTDRGRHGIQCRLEPLRTEGQESRGTTQRIPFAQHEESVHPPTIRVHQSRSRRRYARTLAEENWIHGSFEYSRSSDSNADTTTSDSSEDDFSTVPKFVHQKVAPYHRRTDRWAQGGVVVLYPIGLLVKEEEVNDHDDEFIDEKNNDEEEEFVDDDMDDEFINDEEFNDNDDEELINDEDEFTDSDVCQICPRFGGRGQ